MPESKPDTPDSGSLSQQTEAPQQNPAADAEHGNNTASEPPVVAGQMRVPDRELSGREAFELAKLRPIFGWRLWVTILCLCSGLFLSSLETTIIATALVSISSSLGGYDKSNWVATSYLVTYTGFLIIFARISDMFGRKGTLCGAIIIFTVFSLACGVAQTMDQLIIFRAFQGIGGAGLYSLAMSVIAEITPLRYLGVSSGLMGGIFALSSLLGPIVGGVIASHATWRWVFFLNLPPGVSMLALVLWVFPANVGALPRKRQALSYLDYPGVVLSLAGSTMLTFALEQGGLAYSWNSPPVVIGFIVGGVAFIAFGVWEWFISERRNTRSTSNNNSSGKKRPKMLPLFPIHLANKRVSGFALLTAFLTGFPFMMTLIFLPQRFQLQNGLSPIDAGIRMLALLILSATGAGLGGIIASRRNISWYILVGSLGLQLVGLGLMSTLPTAAGGVRPEQYGYQVLLGLGFGLTLSSLAIVSRMEVDAEDGGVTFSAITQVRVLGGLIGIAVGQAVVTERVLGELGTVLPPEKLAALLRSTAALADFTPEELATTAQTYGEAFNLQNRVMLGFGAAGLLACLGAFKRHPIEFADLDEKQKQRWRAEDQMAADNAKRGGDSAPEVAGTEGAANS